MAVLMARRVYDRILNGSEGFWPALERFWASRDVEKLGITAADFCGLRDLDAGRELR